MARIAVFSIFIVAVAVSSAYAGLIPNLPIPSLPDILPTPGSKDEAIGLVRRGCGAGKGGINLRINAEIEATKRDASLTPVCKQCIIDKASKIREETLAGIDATGDGIVKEIESATLAWLPVWLEVLNDLPSLITGVLTNCRESLDTARSDCIAQTSATTAAA